MDSKIKILCVVTTNVTIKRILVCFCAVPKKKKQLYKFTTFKAVFVLITGHRPMLVVGTSGIYTSFLSDNSLDSF